MESGLKCLVHSRAKAARSSCSTSRHPASEPVNLRLGLSVSRSLYRFCLRLPRR